MKFQNFLNTQLAKDYIYQDKAYKTQIKHAVNMLRDAEVIFIGAGAGLSAAAGLVYNGESFQEHFKEFIKRYGKEYMSDMYQASFYPFKTEEEKWGYWAKHVYVNRIQPKALSLYQELFDLVKDKTHFVLTTNVDHQFQKAGFLEENIFATQGDYGLIQCEKACHNKTYERITMFDQMVKATNNCKVPTYMIPKCPRCGGEMRVNLRSDSHFVEDDKWNKAEQNFSDFLNNNIKKKMVLLELGVGFNTPTIIRLPFEHLMRTHKNIHMIRINLEEAIVPRSFGERIVGIDADIKEVLARFLEVKHEELSDARTALGLSS
ncbi:MAG: Sir2 family NAD-dependent protein deacetylase [Lachnospiraceae bacterium]